MTATRSRRTNNNAFYIFYPSDSEIAAVSAKLRRRNDSSIRSESIAGRTLGCKLGDTNATARSADQAAHTRRVRVNPCERCRYQTPYRGRAAYQRRARPSSCADTIAEIALSVSPAANPIPMQCALRPRADCKSSEIRRLISDKKLPTTDLEWGGMTS